MCGRVTVRTPAKELAEALGLELGEGLPEVARFNVAPSEPIPVVLDEAPKRLAAVRWGLLPHWARDPKIANKLSNARSETAASKPAFRKSFREKRCLIVVDGFYEWQREGGRKQPFLFERGDRGPLTFAGLWDEWISETGEPLRTCTVLTCSANALMGRIHDRMPVLLAAQDAARWLSRDASPEELGKLLAPAPESMLSCREVSPVVNDARHEGEDCIAPPPPPKQKKPGNGQLTLF